MILLILIRIKKHYVAEKYREEPILLYGEATPSLFFEVLR